MNTDLLNISKNLTGEFTIKNPQSRKSRNNSSYYLFEIRVDLLPIKVIAWEESCTGLSRLWHGQRVSINGNWKKFNGAWQVHCHAIQAERQYLKEIKQAKVHLRVMFSWLPEDNLKQFLLRVFNDASIIDDFSTAPASLLHHHAFVGGLMVHSIDVSWKIFNQQHFSPRERYLGVVAGLLHDIGKIKTLTKDMTRSQLGTVVQHEFLNLEILSPHLQWLERHDRELANSLRNLLTWKSTNYDPIPLLDIYEAIKAADRMSSANGLVTNN